MVECGMGADAAEAEVIEEPTLPPLSSIIGFASIAAPPPLDGPSFAAPFGFFSQFSWEGLLAFCSTLFANELFSLTLTQVAIECSLLSLNVCRWSTKMKAGPSNS